MAVDTKMIRAEDFAVRIIELCKCLADNQKKYIISKQLFRSATSIGANIAESTYAESRNDFAHKLCIAQKEAGETLYWLRLLHKTQYIDTETHNSLRDDCSQILTILSSIIRKLKANP